jgi:uncharacterized protein YvpB
MDHISRRGFLAGGLATAAMVSTPLLVTARLNTPATPVKRTASGATPSPSTPTPGTTATPSPAATPAPLRTNYINTPPVVQQRSLDCEAAALQAALLARGTSVTQDWILAHMGADTRPAVFDNAGNIAQWGDPFQTFVGNVDGSEVDATGYGVYHGPIAAAARAAGHQATDGTGFSATAVYQALSAGFPVVIWTDTTFTAVPTSTWTAWDGRSVPYAIGEHAVTLTGIDVQNQTVQLLDVESGQFRTFTMAQFTAFWSTFGNMAVIVQ